MSTFFRSLLQRLLHVYCVPQWFFNVLCIIITCEALKTCMLQCYSVPTESEALEIILGHLYSTKVSWLFFKVCVIFWNHLYIFCNTCFFSPRGSCKPLAIEAG